MPWAVVTAVALAALAALLLGVRTGAGLAHVDPVVVTWLAAHRPGWSVTVATVVADAGSPAAMSVVMVGVTALVAWQRRSWLTVVVGGAGLGAVAGADQLLKHLVARPRPPLVLQAVSDTGFSFPSGHTTLSAGVVVLALWLTTRPAGLAHPRPADPPHPPRWPARRAVDLAAALFLVAVAASRLVLGVHYPSDVLAGWCVAMLADGAVVLLVAAVIRPGPGAVATPVPTGIADPGHEPEPATERLPRTDAS